MATALALRTQPKQIKALLFTLLRKKIKHNDFKQHGDSSVVMHAITLCHDTLALNDWNMYREDYTLYKNNHRFLSVFGPACFARVLFPEAVRCIERFLKAVSKYSLCRTPKLFAIGQASWPCICCSIEWMQAFKKPLFITGSRSPCFLHNRQHFLSNRWERLSTLTP